MRMTLAAIILTASALPSLAANICLNGTQFTFDAKSRLSISKHPTGVDVINVDGREYWHSAGTAEGKKTSTLSEGNTGDFCTYLDGLPEIGSLCDKIVARPCPDTTKTTGNCSPSISDVDGNVTVTMGMSCNG